MSNRISGSEAAVLQGCTEATCRQAEPVLPPKRFLHVSKRNDKIETGRMRCGLEVTPQGTQHVPGRCPGHQTSMLLSNYSQQRFALLSSLSSWLKPQVRNKTMFWLKISLFIIIICYDFVKYLQLMEHCWGVGAAAMLSAGSLPARIRP